MMAPTLLALAYLIGSVPYAFLVGRRAGTPDLRAVGSGNVGATNLFRVSGPKAAALAFVLDAAKGALPVVVARAAGEGAAVTAAAGAAAVLGHVFPCWLRFRGGKGVATALGAFAILAPAAALASTLVFTVVVLTTRYVSAGSVVALLALGPSAAVMGSSRSTVIAGLAVGAFVVLRHRENLARLAAGTERRLGRATGDGEGRSEPRAF